MKTKRKFFTLLILCCSIFQIIGMTNVNALDTNYVDPKENEEMIERANKAPIEPDKVAQTRASYGTYPTRKGVILVTSDKYKGIIPLGHVAIIYTPTTVVESLSEGVTMGNNNWNTSKSQAYGVTVKSTTSAQDAKAADYCYNQRGYPYNYDFFNINTRTKFYCSQLVWAAYKDLYGIDLDTSSYGKAIYPMELHDTDKTSLIYRKK